MKRTEDKYYLRSYTESTYRTYKSKLKKILNAKIIDFTRNGYDMLVVYDKNGKRYSANIPLARIRGKWNERK